MADESSFVLLPLDLKHLSKGALRILAADPAVDLALLQQILVQEKDDPETLRCLIHNPALPDEAFETIKADLSESLRLEIESRQKALALYEAQGGLSTDVADKKVEPHKAKSMQKRIQRMSMVDKIGCALKGPKEARSLLIRDSNKEIALTVLKNPKISDSEVEFYAASTSVSEDIPREIGKNREWCKKYGVTRALVFNPKTPVGIALDKLPLIREKDLQFLSKSKNVPSAVRNGAKGLLSKKKRSS